VSTLGVDGIVSGLDTTSLINSLITADAAPQTLLKAAATKEQSTVTDLLLLNSAVANLATQAKTFSSTPTFGSTSAFNVFTATSSASSVTVTPSTSASAGSISLRVSQLAQAQVGVTAAVTAFSSPAVFTIVGNDGTKTEVTAASSSPADVASAISKAGAGVSAISVASGKDATSGASLYRLQLSASSTGSAGAFTVYQGSAAEVTAGTATNLLTQPGAASISSAQDASVTLWAGTAAEQVITSASNTFASLMPGVDVTVTKVEADPVTIGVARDNTAVTKSASSFVDAMNAIFSTISTKSASTTTTSSTGAGTTVNGTFTANSTVRGAGQQLYNAASQPVNGKSPSTIGVGITRDGTLTFDSTIFAAALAKDPVGTQTMLSTIAGRVAAAADVQSDSTQGVLTQSIKSEKSSLKSMNDQIAQWDVRLASRRASLQTQYTAMEVSLSALKAQSSWLTSQLSALSTSSSTSSSS
jgi:flagellar hook-associated protein 2